MSFQYENESAKAGMLAQKEAAATQISDLQSTEFDVVIVGTGISGSTAAYHLLNAKDIPKSILIVDHGQFGAGTHDRIPVEPNTPLAGHKPIDDKLGDEKRYHPGNSGGVIFSPPHFKHGPTCLKMMVRLYPTTSDDFIHHHGEAGAARYLRLSALGIEIQTRIAKQVVRKADLPSVLEETGSILIADREHAADLEEEFRLLQKCGCNDIELWGEDQIRDMHGEASDFVRGIWFPNDARIDALAYVEAVLAVVKRSQQSKVTLVEYCPTMVKVYDEKDHAVTAFANGAKIRSKHIVVATNALWLDITLAGILKPCWSYFTAMPHGRDPLRPGVEVEQRKLLPAKGGMGSANSANYFTYGFTHDWCITNGVFRISGEDHFSALKPPRGVLRSKALADWSMQKYPYMRALLGPDGQDKDPEDKSTPPKWLRGRYCYGVYGETPDLLPLVGKREPNSRICYLVGCNAWGQASMSMVASLVPGLLGYSPLSAEQAEMADFVAISRFKTQKVYLEGKECASKSKL